MILNVGRQALDLQGRVRLLYLSDFEYFDETYEGLEEVDEVLDDRFLFECSHDVKDSSHLGHDFIFIAHVLPVEFSKDN